MVDYSKWNKIEVSDDEDDTHPNIDNASLFRWRHQARLERMAEFDKRVRDNEANKKRCMENLSKAESAVRDFKTQHPEVEVPEDLQTDATKCDAEIKAALAEEELLNAERKKQAWNVDTLSKPKYTRTLINSYSTEPEKPKTDEALTQTLKNFVDAHKKEAKAFGMLSRSQDSINYLCEHPYLVSEEAANFLCIWCIDLCVEEKIALMERVARQTVSLQFLLELASAQKVHPRDLVRIFFKRLDQMEGEYASGFKNELQAFISRVHERARIRLEEAHQQVEEEERKKRLGPGGLDPIEVMASLPQNLRECFEKKDVEMLKEVMSAMPPADAEYHLKRCIDSGLWVADGNAQSDMYEEAPQPDTVLEADSKSTSSKQSERA